MPGRRALRIFWHFGALFDRHTVLWLPSQHLFSCRIRLRPWQAGRWRTWLIAKGLPDPDGAANAADSSALCLTQRTTQSKQRGTSTPPLVLMNAPRTRQDGS